MDTLHARILVTGGAGFIGSALVLALNQRGMEDIIITDVLDPAKKRNSTESDFKEKRRNLQALTFASYVEADVFRRLTAQNAGVFGQFSAVLQLAPCAATTATHP